MINLKKYIHIKELFYIQKRFTKTPFMFYHYTSAKDVSMFIKQKVISHSSSKYFIPFNKFFSTTFNGSFYLVPLESNVFKQLDNVKDVGSFVGLKLNNFMLNRKDLKRFSNSLHLFSVRGLSIISGNLSSIFLLSFIRIYKLFIFILFNYANSKSAIT
jgi:hypothetical protein